MSTRYTSVILADNQDITAAGVKSFLRESGAFSLFFEAKNKKELIARLLAEPGVLVVLDYSLFDLTSVEELLILQHRFPQAYFLLFSEELTDDLVTRVTCNDALFGILLKEDTKEEVFSAIQAIGKGENFICSRIAGHLSEKQNPEADADRKLTNTEKEILRLIASGKSTKEVANERFLSVHTVTTHRKNIFRKLEINNVHEATKYAMRTGIIDASDYFI
ncbi:helix-turn-helix transcriptional regulator [Bacteroidia bacterium]|nr:helix-turn-helix transcriptional regulator [Bacteroidia bacterium]